MNSRRLNRRTFLAGAAAMALGHAASGASTHARYGEPVRVSVIGCGAHGMRLMEQLARDGARIVAVYDAAERRGSRAAAWSGARQVSDWREAAASRDADAVLIATPTHLNAPIAIAAMTAGKDVYCAPPMALRLEEARAFRDCAVHTGRIVQIGAEPAGQAQWPSARALIRDGAIGSVSWCQGRYRIPPDTATSETGTIDWPAFHAAASGHTGRLLHWRRFWDYSAGVAVESHFDELAGMLRAIGPAFPDRVSAAGGVYTLDGSETPDNLVMAAEYASGPTLVLASTASAGSATIRGSNGSIELRENEVRIVRETADGPRVEARNVSPAPSLVQDWLKSIRTRKPCVCDAELGYRTMAAIAMAVEAYRQRKTFHFDASRQTMTACTPGMKA